MSNLERIIVVGTSAGGGEALTKLIKQLPENIPAAILIVNHLVSNIAGKFLLERIQAVTKLECRMPEQEEDLAAGRIYLAPPDHHMIIKNKKVLVNKGPRENGFRPSVDMLFRSSAAHYNSRVIGIVLTGMLDDGTAGLLSIKKCGGVTIVQHPEDATYPDMPLNVLANYSTDYCLAIAEMGTLLNEIIATPVQQSVPVPKDVQLEAEIAERLIVDIEKVQEWGDRSAYSCPDCGGALYEHQDENLKRFRCEIGHAYTQNGYLRKNKTKIEESLWVALRILEERSHMLIRMSEKVVDKGFNKVSGIYRDKAEESRVHIERLRDMLQVLSGKNEEDEYGGPDNVIENLK